MEESDIKTIRRSEELVSSIDGHQDGYIVEYPETDRSDLLVIYLHSGLARAKQGFCEELGWCFSDLRNEVMVRRGVYASPDYRGDSWLSGNAEADLLTLISLLHGRFATKTLVLVGASMGGTAALIFASLHPEMVRGVIALCAVTDMRELHDDMITREDLLSKQIAKSIIKSYGGTPDEIPHEYEKRSSIVNVENLRMPIILRHGEADPIVSVEHAREMADALKSQGTPVRYDEIAGGNHSAPTVDVPWAEYLDMIL